MKYSFLYWYDEIDVYGKRLFQWETCNYVELRFVENAHSTERESRSVCGKCLFHRDDVIVENAYSTETKLLVMLLWKTLIPPRRNCWWCYCGKRLFHRDETVCDVTSGHSTDNHSQGVCRRRSFYWETCVQDRYFILTDGFRMDCVWRPTGNLTFEDICMDIAWVIFLICPTIWLCYNFIVLSIAMFSIYDRYSFERSQNLSWGEL